MATILIADDSPTVVVLMQRALESLGHRILTAHDGEQARDQINAEHPDLVILDIIMPKLNGYQLCRAIREDEATKDVPIIAVTMMSRDSDRYWGLKQGVNEYLAKPVDPLLLVETVRTYLH